MTATDELRGDCAQCFGLCCVALPFARSADFAFDKPAAVPCRNLHDGDFGCSIHDRLRPSGFPGCTVYDCFGAGQQIAQVTFGGRDWRAHPELAAPMFEAFTVMRQLHELRYYLTQALSWDPAATVHIELRAALATTVALGAGDARSLADLDVNGLRCDIAPLLREASALVRGDGGRDRSGVDLIGVDLRRSELRRADLRATLLIGADLRGVELHLTDLLGADLRDADVRGADLGAALYVTQLQLDAARGDTTTRIPDGLSRPTHWG